MAMLILQCSSGKAPGATPAAFKYLNRANRLAADFMVAGGWAAGWSHAILSAKLGLVDGVTGVEDYDELLTQGKLARYVAAHGAATAALVGDQDVVFYGSLLYLAALQAMLPGKTIQHIGAGGRGIGDYFSALKAELAEYDEAA